MKPYAKRFYKSEAWQRTRNAYFKKRFGICERCGAPGAIVHHKIYLNPRNINDPKVSLNFDNLELLCMDCHNKEHFSLKNMRRTFKNARYTFDESGNVLPPPSKN